MRKTRVPQAVMILTIVLAAGCAPYHQVEDGKCPCAEGWVCCPDDTTCARTNAECPCETRSEVCDGLDDDCDGTIDEDCCYDLSGYYEVRWNCLPQGSRVDYAVIVQDGCDFSFKLVGNQCTGTLLTEDFGATLECQGIGPRNCTGVLYGRDGRLMGSFECQPECTVQIDSYGCSGAPDGTACNDDNYCTIDDTCVDWDCVGTELECDDGDPCTLDSCYYLSGCLYEPKEPCLSCSSDTDCDDQNVCTDDGCIDGFCENRPVGYSKSCDDGKPCTVDDRCRAGNCEGDHRNCEDGNACTHDHCDAPTGECLSETIANCVPCEGDPDCYDGDFCTQDRCEGGRCSHEQEPNGRVCSDGLFCTEHGTCQDGVCQGAAKSCDDSNNCTTDICNEELDVCDHYPIEDCSRLGTLRFVSADPQVLGVAGFGYNESSVVTFEVLDTFDLPSANVEVDFSVGSGATLDPVSALTDENGRVSTVLSSGRYNWTVRVTAEAQWGSVLLSAESPPIRIVGVRPSAGSFLFSCERQNVGGLVVPYLGVQCWVQLSDRYRNLVGIATQVYFRSEAGMIDPVVTSSVEGNVGRAETLLQSSSPHPLNVEPDGSEPFIDVHGIVRNPRDGLATIIAITLGEEEFFDSNGNGQYDPGENFLDLPEPFVDANDNGRYDEGNDDEPGEDFFDTNNNGYFDGPNGVWDEETYIWSQINMLWTGNMQLGDDCQDRHRYSILCPDSFHIQKGEAAEFFLEIKDLNLNPLNDSTVIDMQVEGKGSLGATDLDFPYEVPDLLYGDYNDGGITGYFLVNGAPLDDPSGPEPGAISVIVQYTDDVVGGEIHYDTITVHGTFE